MNLTLAFQFSYLLLVKKRSGQIIFTQFFAVLLLQISSPFYLFLIKSIFFPTHPEKRPKSSLEACMGYSTADACSPSLAFQFPFSFQRKHTGPFYLTRCLFSFTGPLNTSILCGNRRNNKFFRINTGILFITNELSTSVKC